MLDKKKDVVGLYLKQKLPFILQLRIFPPFPRVFHRTLPGDHQ